MTPSEFQRALDQEFLGEMRLRWSNPRRAWLLEAKAGRGIYDTPVAVQGFRLEDERVQLRDGYRLFMEVRESDRMPCHGCWQELHPLTPFTTVQIECGRCRYIQQAACFPLGDSLLDHLRKLNPRGTYRQNVIRAADRANAAREAVLMRDAKNVVEASTLDMYNQLVEIPSFGYAGKTGAWTDAPASPLAS